MEPVRFEENIFLENDRVLLRPLLKEDFDQLLYFSENEPEIWKYSLANVSGKTNLEIYIANAIRTKNALTAFPFIVYDKKFKAYAGSTRFYDLNTLQRNMLLGNTWYGKQFQGTGLNKNCKYLLLQYAFENMKMERIELRADNGNERSKAAMRSMGATEEGILRKDCYNAEGGRRDSVVFSILKEEWFNCIKEKLQNAL